MATTRFLLLSLAGVFLASLVSASGFSISDQGARASGMAGAFTAIADDPTSIFYNPGGIAWVEKKASVGTSGFTLGSGLFQGQPPGLAAGTAGELDGGTEIRAHAFFIAPVNDRAKLGIGIYQPFGFHQQWRDPDRFSGRALSTESELETFELNTSLGFEVHPKLAIGLGAFVRSSEISYARRIQGTNPVAPGGLIDLASLGISTDMETGLGFTAGFLFRATERFSIGVSHRSAVDVDYGGSGVLTQIPTGNQQLDDLVAASLPLDEELQVSTTLELPASTSLGLAFQLTEALRFAVDFEQIDWSSVQALRFRLPSQPALENTVALNFDDAVDLRLGLVFETSGGSQFRLGAALEESPQPDSTVGPFYSDADRTLTSIGYGKDWLDMALIWQQLEDRSVTGNLDRFNGNYRGNAWSFVLTVTK